MTKIEQPKVSDRVSDDEEDQLIYDRVVNEMAELLRGWKKDNVDCNAAIISVMISAVRLIVCVDTDSRDILETLAMVFSAAARGGISPNKKGEIK